MNPSLRGLCGEYEDAGGEHEREGEAGGDGVALEVEEERREHVGRLKKSDEVKVKSLSQKHFHSISEKKKNSVMQLHFPGQSSAAQGRTR